MGSKYSTDHCPDFHTDTMVENVKGIGGSGYVVKKDATVLEEYFEK